MPKACTVKFKQAGKVYNYDLNNLNVKANDIVVVNSLRGKELATVVNPEVNASKESLSEPLLTVERIATNEDKLAQKENDNKKEYVLKEAKKLISKLQLNMKLVDAEFTLDSSKVIISFVCEDRVDFRDLVKELAGILKLRIELRQIGIRDQAKVVGAIGCCGQEACCSRYLNDFDKVSIKMAKTQNLSLNPTKISGVCGRLMCCLSYENEHYADMLKKMPKINSKVSTPGGLGTVIYNNLLKEKVTVKIECGDDVKIVEYDLGELTNLENNSLETNNSENDVALPKLEEQKLETPIETSSKPKQNKKHKYHKNNNKSNK
jgi:cell fate regulator YaaT (PSP1 superfamily)